MKHLQKMLSALLALALIFQCGFMGSVKASASETNAPAITDMHYAPEADATNEELFAGYAAQTFYGSNMSFFGSAAGEMLTGDEKILYDALVPYIRQIANGERASATIAVGQTVTASDGVTYIADVEAVFSGATFTNNMFARVVNALLADLPYEMYWFDKSSGCGIYTIGGLIQVGLQFAVASNYRGTDIVIADTAKTGTAKAAAANAQTIVDKYAAASDYEKLVGYKNEICALVSYDQLAAEGNYFNTDIDPWQLISVFDGDSSTNVVCEGYSKAFMYLCDMTDFNGDVSCYTVTGYMDDENHMWNVVEIEGKRYLTDVTNSDAGTVGENGGLFLAGATGSADGDYIAADVAYIYDYDTQSLWGTDADSILTLEATDYEPEVDDNIASGKCGDNLTWVLDSDGVLTISGKGAMYDYNQGGQPWYGYRAYVKEAVIEDGVTSIGSSAFYECVKLTEVSIPEGVTRLGYHAFYHCAKLETVVLPNTATDWGESVFDSCTKLSSVTLPESLTGIGQYAFQGCTSLETIALPDTVTSLSDYAFAHSGLTEIELPAGLTKISSYALAETNLTSIVIPEGVTSLDYVFYGCSKLESANVPGSVTRADHAFENCTALTDVELGEGLTKIWNSMFYYCSSLEQINIPSTVTELEAYAFNASGIRKIKLPEGLLELHNSALGATKLTTVTIPANVLEIGEYMFCPGTSSLPEETVSRIVFTGDAPIMEEYTLLGITANAYYPVNNTTWTEDVRQNYGGTITWVPYVASGTCGDNLTWIFNEETGTLTISGTGNMYDYLSGSPWNNFRELISKVVIEDGVTSIGADAFTDCKNLISVEMPAGINGIGEGAFAYCSNLIYVNIPKGVTVIGTYAFCDCTNLSTVEIPESVTSIGRHAFGVSNSDKSWNLEYIYFKGDGCTIESNTFYGLQNVTVCYPAGNLTWTENLMQDYGANNIIWKPYCYGEHTAVTTPAVEPTCTEIGLTDGSHCLACGEVIVDQKTVAAKGHTEETVAGKTATCTEAGLTEGKKCSVCDVVTVAQETIAAKGHTEETVAGKAATCTEAGLTEGKKCSVCGGVTVAQETVSATGIHIYKNEVCKYCGVEAPAVKNQLEDLVDKEANADQIRDAVQSMDTEELKSSMEQDSVAVQNMAALEQNVGGAAEVTVEDKSVGIVEDEVSIVGANLNSVAEGKSAVLVIDTAEKKNAIPETYDTDSAVHFSMTLENVENAKKLDVPVKITLPVPENLDPDQVVVLHYHDGKTDVLTPAIHQEGGKHYASVVLTGFSDFAITQKTHKHSWVDATCTEAKTCSACGATDGEPLGHNYYTSEVTKEPTCTEAGVRTYTCANDATHTDPEAISATGHTAVTDAAVAPTCTKTGLTEGSHCSNCNNVLVKQETVSAMGHAYDGNVDGTCNVCKVNRETVETRQVTHMFRMYNPNTGEHFYTGSEVERENLIVAGWNYEGVGFTFPANTGAPVHRLFQPSTGEHLYTMDEDEMNRLIAEGWNYEGIAFNSAYDTEAVQHRLHNPNATVGAYHFTFSEVEMQNLIAAGWEYQGIGWYSCWK